MNAKWLISFIDTLRDGWYNPPTNYYQKQNVDFMYQSYAHSAMNEIKFYLMKHEGNDPISTIENFRDEMDEYACKAKNADTNFMFSVYHDVASDVLDVLLGRN